MNRLYMVEFTLPELLTEEFVQLIPEQRRKTDELLADGVIKSYSLALDRSRLWVIMTADSEFDALHVLLDLPLTHHMTPEISELAFHNSEEMALHFSLN